MAKTREALSAEQGPKRKGLKVRRRFTREGTHPYDELTWERRDAVITNWRDGSVAFEQRDLEFPSTWSQNATNIVAQKYFRGPLGTPQRERSVRQMVDRVAGTITAWGRRDGYFAGTTDATIFQQELTHLLVNQKAAFNSPVWFNLGVEDRPQASACFILSVDDNMPSILNWYVEEGMIFKGGSGSGINLSTIRSSKEPLGNGGEASGPVSFMRGADSSAGTIKCLHHDTEVMTDRGMLRIADVRDGDFVATRRGYRRVAEVHDNGIRSLVRVRTALGDEILCTPEHRFRVRGVDGETWREAGQLRPDDYVMIDLASTDTGEPQLLRPVKPGHHNEISHPLPATLDEAFALWLGWVYGDGSITSRPAAKFIALQIGDSDPELVDRYVALTRTVFGEAAHIFVSRSPRKDASASVRFSSSQVIRFLEANGLRKGKAGDLRVPQLVKSSPASVRAAFLAGVFEADGHVGNGYPTVSTINREFAVDLHRLLLSIGIPSKLGVIDDRETAHGRNPVHTVRVVGGLGVERFAKLVGFVSERKSRLLEAAVSRKRRSPFENAWILPHVHEELDNLWRRSGPALKRKLAPYTRYTTRRALSLLRARALLRAFPEELGESSLAGFARGEELYVPVTVEPAGEGPTFDLTVERVHEYLVHNVVTHNSGGKTRRAAKMVILNVDHPDVRDFIWCKAREEHKARALRDAGFDMDLDGRDAYSIQYQNANNSVRVTDEFMRAYEADGTFDLRAVLDGHTIETVRARELMREIAQAAWECADPGMQYDTTINDWHTTPESGRIDASNPCSEYMHLNNSACNLASLNLLKFLRDDGVFDVAAFRHAVEIVFLAQEIIVGGSSYPTERIGQNARDYRQLGLGYANLGALLMAEGKAYDSDGGRAWAGAITALMTGHAYRTSARVAQVMGPFEGFAKNRAPMLRVMRKHRAAVDDIDASLVQPDLLDAARTAWDEALTLGEENGYRNAQASVLAPTGTIALLMDCDTTGIEPDLALVKTKKLVGGGSMSIVNQTVPRALRRLGYAEEHVQAILEHIASHNSVDGAPALRREHYEVFDCAMGDRPIHYMGHVRMMAAAQPFISGAISKTTNLPESATVEEVEQVYVEGWKLGLKALAIYRDNCKVGQPLSATKAADKKVTADSGAVIEVDRAPVRRRLPKARPSTTTSFRVGDIEGYLTAGSYPESGLGEIFVKVSKQGSTLSGVMDALAIAVSLGLQYGVPLEAYVAKFTNMIFEPNGLTDDRDVRIAQSLVDYIARRLAIDYLDAETRHALGIKTTAERMAELEAGGSTNGVNGSNGSNGATVPATPPAERQQPPRAAAQPTGDEIAVTPGMQALDAPYCSTCGVRMRPAGSCFVCESCGTTSGCS